MDYTLYTVIQYVLMLTVSYFDRIYIHVPTDVNEMVTLKHTTSLPILHFKTYKVFYQDYLTLYFLSKLVEKPTHQHILRAVSRDFFLVVHCIDG